MMKWYDYILWQIIFVPMRYIMEKYERSGVWFATYIIEYHKRKNTIERE